MTDELELSIVVLPNALPVRVPLLRVLTTIGSAPDADLRLVTVAKEWALVKREGEKFTFRQLATKTTHELLPGRPLVVDGVEVTLKRPETSDRGLAGARFAETLADAKTPAEALEGLLHEMLAAADADSGAVLLRDGADYTVAAARQRDGSRAEGAELLLSDTVVREVLGQGATVRVGDASESVRYARIPSVVAMRLRTMLCVPMKLHGGVVGALFLGKRDVRAPFSPKIADDVALVAQLAVPLLVQLRARSSESAESATVEGLLVGESEKMVELRSIVSRVAPSDLSVLLAGETGSGKEVAAQAIHAASRRRGKPMVAINCSAVPEGLLAAELFGAKKGSFTGAVTDRIGKIEQADGSTLFLDEAGDMPLGMQAALLRVLEQREVVRVGENEPRKVDFRLIAATHKDLDAEVRAGRFREDLLYRLREVTVTLPPLAARGNDVLLLARLFLRQTEKQLGLPPRRLGEPAERAIVSHPWPGNVRELRAAIRRAAVLALATEISPKDLQLNAPARVPVSEVELGDLDRKLDEAKEEFVARYVKAVVDKHGGDRAAAADALGVSVRSIYRYLGG